MKRKIMILENETKISIGKFYKDASKKAKIICKCDYCGSVFERLKHNLERSYKFIKKDACNSKPCTSSKKKEIFVLNYGVENPFANKEVKEKIKKTNVEKFGYENPLQNKDIKEKQKKTNLEKFGCENPFKNKEVRKKQKKTIKEKFGVDHYSQTEGFREKIIATTILRHGQFPVGAYGKKQKEIQDWLNSFGFNFKPNHELISPMEIDLYDESKNLAIEYCGLHWHHEKSPEPRMKHYHHKKYVECINKNTQLLTIFSDEWEQRQSQCKSHIKSILGVNDQRLYARKCEIKEIDKKTGCDFFNQYHIQGRNKLGIFFYALFNGTDICGAMSFGRHNRNYDVLTLDRLCFKDGIQIVGGASKLFNSCIERSKKEGYNEVISFSDNRWSIGKVYQALNFTLDKECKPDYSYVYINREIKRLSKQSQKKSAVNCPADLTELEWATERNLARIWDCGKKRWKFNF